jgi:hypothetical protein
MRAPRLAVAITCCALYVGCSRPPVEHPASASVTPPAAASAPSAAKSPKRVATSEISSGMQIDSASSSFDVNSLNPVKMDRNAASGSGFNPFAQ